MLNNILFIVYATGYISFHYKLTHTANYIPYKFYEFLNVRDLKKIDKICWKYFIKSYDLAILYWVIMDFCFEDYQKSIWEKMNIIGRVLLISCL